MNTIKKIGLALGLIGILGCGDSSSSHSPPPYNPPIVASVDTPPYFHDVDFALDDSSNDIPSDFEYPNVDYTPALEKYGVINMKVGDTLAIRVCSSDYDSIHGNPFYESVNTGLDARSYWNLDERGVLSCNGEIRDNGTIDGFSNYYAIYTVYWTAGQNSTSLLNRIVFQTYDTAGQLNPTEIEFAVRVTQ